jgi:hypothetical protein
MDLMSGCYNLVPFFIFVIRYLLGGQVTTTSDKEKPTCVLCVRDGPDTRVMHRGQGPDI